MGKAWDDRDSANTWALNVVGRWEGHSYSGGIPEEGEARKASYTVKCGRRGPSRASACKKSAGGGIVDDDREQQQLQQQQGQGRLGRWGQF